MFLVLLHGTSLEFLCSFVQWALSVSQSVQKPRSFIFSLSLTIFKIVWLLLEVALSLLLSVAILFSLTVQVGHRGVGKPQPWRLIQGSPGITLVTGALSLSGAGAGPAPRTAARGRGPGLAPSPTRQGGGAGPALAAPLLRKLCFGPVCSHLGCWNRVPAGALPP